VLAADLILHVRDIAHPEAEAQAADVAAVLAALGVPEAAPRLEVWNKIDLLDAATRASLMAAAARRPDVLALSAATGAGLGALSRAVCRALSPPRDRARVALPHGDGRRRAWLYDRGVVEAESHGAGETVLSVRWTAGQARAFRDL